LAADAVHDVAAGNAKSRYCLRAVAVSARAEPPQRRERQHYRNAAAIVADSADPDAFRRQPDVNSRA